MYRIIDGRGTGKTSRLLLLAKENDGIVVCKNPDHMREKAYAYGLTGIDFASYYEYFVTFLTRFSFDFSYACFMLLASLLGGCIISPAGKSPYLI